MIRKIIIFFIALLFTSVTTFAGMRSDISNVISKSGINRSSLSVSIKNAYTGKAVYELNPTMPVSPASNQKILTATAAFMTLGNDYRFSTELYRNKDNKYIVKLGADPYLTSKELEKIVKFIPKEPGPICIDSSIIDDNNWGEGWQWDDDLNPYMPKFSAYNLDKNLMEITITPSMKGYPAVITKDSSYPLTFINNTKTANTTKLSIKRQNHISPDTIIVDGTIQFNKSTIKDIPINNPKKYFKLKLSEAIINRNISCSGEYEEVKITPNDSLMTCLSHDIKQAKKDVYKNSNNMVAETVFKIAGGKFANQTGSFELGREMFYDFCKKHQLDCSDIKLTDASGVSKNNLMTTDFMTEFLIKVRGFLEPELPTAGEGTLSNRMLYLKNYVHAKTGTLNNISAISGYIVTKRNQKYVFSIIINNADFSDGDKKMLEEYIIRTIYTKG